MSTRSSVSRISNLSQLCMVFAVVLWVGLNLVNAQTFSTKLLFDTNTPRPDHNGNFDPNPMRPSLEGSIATFWSQDSIWTMNVDKGTFIKLADFSTPVPGGVGTFSSFFDTYNDIGGLSPQVKNGIVIFYGKDATGGGGIYSVPASGGKISLVANYATPLPDGDFFINQNVITYFSFDGVHVLVQGGFLWSYIANVDGTHLITYADQNTGLNSDDRYDPAGDPTIAASIDGNRVSGIGKNIFDEYNGFNAVFTFPSDTTVQSDGPNYTSTPHVNNFNSHQPLPGDTEQSYHTRLASVILDGNTVYFAADNSYGTYYGLFSANANTLLSQGGPANLLLNNQTGLSFGPGGFSQFTVDNGNVAVAANHGDAALDYFLLSGGGLYQMTMQESSVNRSLGRRALSNGRVIYLNNGSLSSGLYLAAPESCGANIVPQIAVIQGLIRYNSKLPIILQSVRLVNTGNTRVDGPIALYLTKLPAGATFSNRSGVSACIAPGSPYIVGLKEGQHLDPGAGINLQLVFGDSTGGLISYTPVVSAGSGLL